MKREPGPVRRRLPHLYPREPPGGRARGLARGPGPRLPPKGHLGDVKCTLAARSQGSLAGPTERGAGGASPAPAHSLPFLGGGAVPPPHTHSSRLHAGCFDTVLSKCSPSPNRRQRVPSPFSEPRGIRCISEFGVFPILERCWCAQAICYVRPPAGSGQHLIVRYGLGKRLWRTLVHGLPANWV